VKEPIAWHKECLANSERWLVEKWCEIQRLQEALERAREKQTFYRAQIERAEAEGRDGFDREKFGVKRAKQ
jgi:hypothetical protein